MKSYRVKVTNKPKELGETVKYVPILEYEFLVEASNKKSAKQMGIDIWTVNLRPRVESIERIKEK